jgi:hypothetical protein
MAIGKSIGTGGKNAMLKKTAEPLDAPENFTVLFPHLTD